MDYKRSTPQTKEPIIRGRRTPVNLNSSVMPGTSASGSKPFLRSGSQLFKAHSLLNLNSTISIGSGCPNIKRNLTYSNATDNSIQEKCDSAYNDYLLSLMKKEIVSKRVKQYDQEIKDQLATKRDNLHKTKMALKKMKQEIDNSETLYQLNELTDCLLENVNNCLKLNDDYDLIHILKEILAVLESMCNKVQVKNFKSVSDQDGVDKLGKVLEKCVNTFQKVDSSIRPIESINKLGELMKNYQKLVNSVTEIQNLLNKQHVTETSKLLEFISDIYVQKEN